MRYITCSCPRLANPGRLGRFLPVQSAQSWHLDFLGGLAKVARYTGLVLGGSCVRPGRCRVGLAFCFGGRTDLGKSLLLFAANGPKVGRLFFQGRRHDGHNGLNDVESARRRVLLAGAMAERVDATLFAAVILREFGEWTDVAGQTRLDPSGVCIFCQLLEWTAAI